jgi:hypothetical protein
MERALIGNHAFYTFYILYELFLDEVLQRHLREGTAGTVPLQLYLHDPVIDLNELNISTIYAKAFPDLFQGDLYVILEVLHEYFSPL